jgi:hypothetical protein
MALFVSAAVFFLLDGIFQQSGAKKASGIMSKAKAWRAITSHESVGPSTKQRTK